MHVQKPWFSTSTYVYMILCQHAGGGFQPSALFGQVVRVGLKGPVLWSIKCGECIVLSLIIDIIFLGGLFQRLVSFTKPPVHPLHVCTIYSIRFKCYVATSHSPYLSIKLLLLLVGPLHLIWSFYLSTCNNASELVNNWFYSFLSINYILRVRI